MRPAPRGDVDDRARQVVGLLLEHPRPEHRGELAQRRERALLILGELLARRAHPQQVELRAEALGRAPGAAHEPLGARVGLDEREQALADRLRRVGREALLARADELGGQALGADLLGDLAQRDLAQRRRGSRCGRSC